MSITSLDLTMNNLAQGLPEFFKALEHNSSVVCLRLKNNNIDGRRLSQELT